MLYGGNIAESWLIFGTSDVFESLTRRQIEAVRVLGGNAIRVMGHPAAVLDGVLTLQNYLNRWDDIIQFCGEVDMTLYPCGYSGHLRGGKSAAELLTVLEPWAAFIGQFTNIYGIDVCNEPTHGGGASVSEAATLYNTLKPLTSLPLTFSDYQTSQGGSPWTIHAAFAPYLPYCDYLDLHNYGDTGLDKTALNGIAAAYPSKRIVIGEFGSPASAAESARVLRVKNSLAIAQHENCDGAFVWSVFDYDTVPANQYGMYRGVGKPPNPALAAAWEAGINPPHFRDYFNGTGTLQAHAPDIGTSWGASGLSLDGNGNIASGSGSAAANTATALPADVKATISFTHSGASSGNNVGVYLRRQANGDAYLVRVRSEGSTAVKWEIYKYIGGVWQTPISNAGTLPTGKTYQFTASVVGSVLTLLCAEQGQPLTTRATWTDAAPLAAGNVLLSQAHAGGMTVHDFEVRS